jgi:3-mercaptopyruvate sulfurtransferase SseA
VFLLRLLGYTEAKNYDASMGEWANREDTPMER